MTDAADRKTRPIVHRISSMKCH